MGGSSTKPPLPSTNCAPGVTCTDNCNQLKGTYTEERWSHPLSSLTHHGTQHVAYHPPIHPAIPSLLLGRDYEPESSELERLEIGEGADRIAGAFTGYWECPKNLHWDWLLAQGIRCRINLQALWHSRQEGSDWEPGMRLDREHGRPTYVAWLPGVCQLDREVENQSSVFARIRHLSLRWHVWLWPISKKQTNKQKMHPSISPVCVILYPPVETLSPALLMYQHPHEAQIALLNWPWGFFPLY